MCLDISSCAKTDAKYATPALTSDSTEFIIVQIKGGVEDRHGGVSHELIQCAAVVEDGLGG